MDVEVDPNELYAVPEEEQLDVDPVDEVSLAEPTGTSFAGFDPDAGEVVDIEALGELEPVDEDA